MSKTYFEKLKDPRWQKKRLEVMERAEFKCELCGETDKELHIHHCYYDGWLEPWEYKTKSLRCLCSDCHEEENLTRKEICAAIACLPVVSFAPIFKLITTIDKSIYDFLGSNEQKEVTFVINGSSKFISKKIADDMLCRSK